ncbi:hypothetical protein diail_694 [Diaporthe ilicicola]|nr:hypothetical protein diail_694 [Diaporthe ilicicola]
MDDQATQNSIDESSSVTGRWPVSFRLKQPKPKQQGGHGHEPKDAGPSKQLWWSYDLYRGPRNQKPKVLYARSKPESEEIAEAFGNEKVLGFDMEWPSYDGTNSKEGRLQDKIGVITIACENKIALFHLGAYTGNSPSDFIGPALRRLIESPDIVKAGVNILAADFRRLRDFYGLEPKGAVELSHLHNLVTHGASGEFSLCTTKLCALGEQVQTHLGLPLKKSSVRTSNWSQRKQLSREQKSYAASDAYAGFMLYHYLNYLRLSMEPRPPPLLYAERYRSIDVPGRGTGLLLQLDNPDDRTCLTVLRAVDFFEGRHDATHTVEIAPWPRNIELVESQDSSSPAPASQGRNNVPSGPRRSRGSVPSRRQTRRPRKQPNLLRKLKDHRDRIAKQRRLETWKIIHNSALELVAKHRPENEMDLMQLKGIGPQTVKKYGAAILNIVAIHVAEEQAPIDTEAQSDNEVSGRDDDGDDTVSVEERPAHLPEEVRSSSSNPGTLATRAVQQIVPGSGSQSDPIELDGEADAAPPESPSQRALKRRRTPSGPRHGLLRYFKVGKNYNREATIHKP